MTPQGKKRLIIGTSLVVILGVVGYFIYKKFSESKPEETPPPSPDTSGGGGASNTNSGGGSGGGGLTSGNPFSTSEELKKFQEWVINTKKDTSIGKVDGLWGSKSAKAWTKYGEEYKKSSTLSNPVSDPKQWNVGDKVFLNGEESAIFSFPANNYILGKVERKVFLSNPIGIVTEVGTEWLKFKSVGYRPSITGGWGPYQVKVTDAFVRKPNVKKTPY